MLFFVARDCLGVILAATVADTVGLNSTALGVLRVVMLDSSGFVVLACH